MYKIRNLNYIKMSFLKDALVVGYMLIYVTGTEKGSEKRRRGSDSP